MKINSIGLMNSSTVNSKTVEQQNVVNANSFQPDRQMGLADIRSNQILLPNNKIYVPQGSAPTDFNKKGITVTLPVNLEEINKESEDKTTTISRAQLRGFDVKQYKNTQTGADVIRATKNIFTKEGVLNSSEVMEVDLKDTSTGVRYIEDYEHNTVTEIKLSNPLAKGGRSITDEVTTLYKDDSGKVVKKEQYIRTPIKGVYDIKETDANGNEHYISKTTIKDDGGYSIKKDMTSLDGTRTVYQFDTDKDGNHKTLFCQISDKDGNVLSTIDRTYDRKEDGIYSSVNGVKYKQVKTKDGFEITNLNSDEVTNFSSKNFEPDMNGRLLLMMSAPNRQFDYSQDVVTPLAETLPADTLVTMSNNIKQVFPLKDDLESAFVGFYDYLMCKTDNFVVNHELGHSKDAVHVTEDENILDRKDLGKNVIADNSEFRTAFLEEKAAFVQAFPDYKEKFVNYFISSPESKPQRGRKETVAESNAINGLQPKEPEILAMRTILLQRYFPRSIAAATKLMNPVAQVENSEKTQENTDK
jgi:hypothetical protein